MRLLTSFSPHHTFLLPLAVACLGACGGSTTGSGARASVGGEQGMFVDQLADQLCATADQCCSAHGHTPPSDCVVRAREQLHENVDTEILAGATFDAKAAADCIAAFRDLAPSCPATWSPPPACHEALIGTSPPGGSCDPGCAPSSDGAVVCAFSLTLGGDGGQTRSPSICQVEIVAPPGESCDTELTRPTVRVCDTDNGSWCFGGKCSVPSLMGQSCHGNDCVAGTYCKGSTCQPKVKLGQPCEGLGGECTLGTSCDATTNTCTAPDRLKKLCGGDFN